MADENKMTGDNNLFMKHCLNKKGIKKHGNSGIAGGIYCMGFIGAAVYFIQQATSFGTGVLGFLKALAWPAFLIYNLMEFLKM